MASSLCKIHVNNSTGVSLNERFTAITTKPKVTVGRRSRSRSMERPMQRVEHVTTRANQRFLAELQRKHKVQAAMKLKRRSMRTVAGGGTSGGGSFGRIKRGSVKTLRVGANGKPIRTNSLANIATMNADREALNRRPALRRSNSSGSLVNRLGPRRPAVGGAAQRIAKRRLDRQRGGVGERGGRSMAVAGRGRSRNRSLTRPQENARSRSRTRYANSAPVAVRGRSRSRSRNPVRGRSRSRGREGVAGRNALPIKARLGVRPGATGASNRTMQNNRQARNNRPSQQNNRRGGGNANRRNASLTRRGVQTGRVQKRRNSVVKNNVISNTGANGRNSRPRSRSAVRNANGNFSGQQQRTPRPRSRTRKGQVGQQTQRGQGQAQQQRRRGRSQQRRGGATNNPQKGSNNTKSNKNNQQQQRRGRSRSRTGGRGGGPRGGGPRNQGGKQTKPGVNKDELDKELDQYMATTKTENDMDFLLKN